MSQATIKAKGMVDLFFVVSRKFITFLFLFIAIGVAGFYLRDGGLVGIFIFPVAIFIGCMIFISVALMLIALYQRPEMRVAYNRIQSWGEMKEFNRKII